MVTYIFILFLELFKANFVYHYIEKNNKKRISVLEKKQEKIDAKYVGVSWMDLGKILISVAEIGF